MKPILLALALTLAAALPVRAQVTFDASATSSSPASGWSHTVTGTNTVLLVALSYSAASPITYVSTISWNGQSLTRFVTATQFGLGIASDNAIDTWYLVGATAGTASFVLTGGSLGMQGGVSLSYRNVLQVAPVGPIPGLIYNGQFNSRFFPLQMAYDGASAPGGLAVMVAILAHPSVAAATPTLLNDGAIAVSIDTTGAPGMFLLFVTAPVKQAGGPLGLASNGGVLLGGNGFNDWTSTGLLLAPLASYAVVGK